MNSEELNKQACGVPMIHMKLIVSWTIELLTRQTLKHLNDCFMAKDKLDLIT